MAERYGLLAGFDDPALVVAAARTARAQGYRDLEAFTPFPVDGLHEALGRPGTRLGWVVLAGGALGAVGSYGLQVYLNAVDYPLNVGGRPLHSWPEFLVVSLQVAVLAAGLAAFGGMLVLNGLPMPHHPVFNSEHYSLAGGDRFFLCVRASDPQFDPERTRSLLEGARPVGVWEVPR